MHKQSTAGQATIEYIAAIALVAAILVLAAPAVGAPDLGKLVAGKMRLALCVVANDVCTDKMAKEAGLAPCALGSDTTGHEIYATGFSIEVGHRWTMTVTPQSDGSVTVVQTASGSVGVAGDAGLGVEAGPVVFDAGAQASARGRIQAALGWTFKDQATADRFLKHAVLNSINTDDFPSTWQSVEGGGELAGTLGISGGVKGAPERVELFGFGASLAGAIGGRKARGGMYTIYGRATLEGADVAVPFLPSIGRGREDWLVEYTFGHGQPRELVFRHGAPSEGSKRLTETVMRLDLRDPANLAAAKPLLDSGLRPAEMRSRVGDVLRWIDTHGIVETSVSEVDDKTWGAGLAAGVEVKFGVNAKDIEVHRKLISASARTGGPYERERFDCQR